MLRMNRFISMILLLALLISACQPIVAPMTTTEEPLPEMVSGYVDNNGVQIYYEVEGQGPPLMLVHWASGSIQDWRIFGYVDALKDDYRLILVDMRGHGQSDKPHDPAVYGAETQVSDIIAVLDELGIDKTNYFGYSLGGRLGWALATYAPERFNSLIIGGHIPTIWDDSAWADQMFAAGVDGWAKGLEEFARSLDLWSPEIYPAYATADLEAIALASHGLNSASFESSLPEMHMPILLIAGTNDDFYPGMEAAAQQLPNGAFVPLNDLDHGKGFLLIDQVLPHITAFLATVSGEEDLAVGITTATLDEATIAEIETLIEQTMADNQIPGFAIGIVRDGEVIYAKGFGVAELGSDRSMTPETPLPVASLSKQFTAVAIMQLVEAGKLELDAPVTDYLPYFTLQDPRDAAITIRQLLAHTSGMPQIPLIEYGFDTSDPGAEAREAYVRALAELKLDMDPGETWAYSNLGYNVLGDVIAKISGETYEVYLRQHILTPLGMDSSTFLFDEIDFASLARGHYLAEEGNVVMTDAFPYARAYAPAAGLVTNLNDLMHWASAISNRGAFAQTRILQESSCDEMWSPVSTLGWGGLMQDYGLGWIVAEAEGHQLAWHLGTFPGYQASVIVAPDDGIGVVTLDNFLSPAEEQPWSATDVGNAVMLMILPESD